MPGRGGRRRFRHSRGQLGGALPAEIRSSPIGSRSTSAASTRTRAARSSSTTSSATPRLVSDALHLVLIGTPIIPIPSIRSIQHLGFVDDRDKFDALAAAIAPDHAVVLREPVDGSDRSVGARQARARQRPLRRAQGPVHPQQRRALLRELHRVRRDAARHRYLSDARGRARRQRPPLLRAATTPGRSSRASTSTCSRVSPASHRRRKSRAMPWWFQRRREELRPRRRRRRDSFPQGRSLDGVRAEPCTPPADAPAAGTSRRRRAARAAHSNASPAPMRHGRRADSPALAGAAAAAGRSTSAARHPISGGDRGRRPRAASGRRR